MRFQDYKLLKENLAKKFPNFNCNDIYKFSKEEFKMKKLDLLMEKLSQSDTNADAIAAVIQELRKDPQFAGMSDEELKAYVEQNMPELYAGLDKVAAQEAYNIAQGAADYIVNSMEKEAGVAGNIWNYIKGMVSPSKYKRLMQDVKSRFSGLQPHQKMQDIYRRKGIRALQTENVLSNPALLGALLGTGAVAAGTAYGIKKYREKTAGAKWDATKGYLGGMFSKANFGKLLGQGKDVVKAPFGKGLTFGDRLRYLGLSAKELAANPALLTTLLGTGAITGGTAYGIKKYREKNAAEQQFEIVKTAVECLDEATHNGAVEFLADLNLEKVALENSPYTEDYLFLVKTAADVVAAAKADGWFNA